MTVPERYRNLADRFGENLLRLRQQAGFSQEELSFMASLHRTEVGTLERGTRLPRLDTIIKLAGALEVEPGDLCRGMYWQAGTLHPGGFAVAGGDTDADEEPAHDD